MIYNSYFFYKIFLSQQLPDILKQNIIQGKPDSLSFQDHSGWYGYTQDFFFNLILEDHNKKSRLEQTSLANVTNAPGQVPQGETKTNTHGEIHSITV